MATKKWTDEEEEFLQTNYMVLSNAELAEKYDISKNAVQKKLARMGLKRSQAVKEPTAEEAPERDVVEEEDREVISTESHFFLGNKCFYEDRNYEQAIKEYRQAAAEEPNELIRLKACYWMAESHIKIGKIEEAIKILSQLAEQNGDSYLGDSAKKRAESLME